MGKTLLAFTLCVAFMLIAANTSFADDAQKPSTTNVKNQCNREHEFDSEIA
jgi:hypothetical protein